MPRKPLIEGSVPLELDLSPPEQSLIVRPLFKGIIDAGSYHQEDEGQSWWSEKCPHQIIEDQVSGVVGHPIPDGRSDADHQHAEDQHAVSGQEPFDVSHGQYFLLSIRVILL